MSCACCAKPSGQCSRISRTNKALPSDTNLSCKELFACQGYIFGVLRPQQPGISETLYLVTPSVAAGVLPDAQDFGQLDPEDSFGDRACLQYGSLPAASKATIKFGTFNSRTRVFTPLAGVVLKVSFSCSACRSMTFHKASCPRRRVENVVTNGASTTRLVSRKPLLSPIASKDCDHGGKDPGEERRISDPAYGRVMTEATWGLLGMMARLASELNFSPGQGEAADLRYCIERQRVLSDMNQDFWAQPHVDAVFRANRSKIDLAHNLASSIQSLTEEEGFHDHCRVSMLMYFELKVKCVEFDKGPKEAKSLRAALVPDLTRSATDSGMLLFLHSVGACDCLAAMASSSLPLLFVEKIENSEVVDVECKACGKSNEERALLRCSRCRVVSYCDVVCQRQDWK